ncbi:uncharacterized protein LOC112089284 [Eutrema salsugineum]|uniref:uncharacterized protein LOC112089284 n=1 Tax=Eutrema salsugineum TaxID=72664 RepID=UPI000CED76ED|nr:uncharacterized protein LOC112089284 [Eutrema salsugineum]
MASSSNDPFSDERFDDLFDQTMDHLFDTLSEIQAPPKPKKKRAFIERERELGHQQLWNDYFSEDCTYPLHVFRRRFRMNKPLFMHIVDRLSEEVSYFKQKRDAAGRFGLSALQKCTAAIRIMAYGSAADAGVINVFGDEYLRRPTADDLQRLLDVGQSRGFSGIIGSIDCMHWEWKNCPTAWRGQYTRGSEKPTIVLKVVTSYDLWFWHAFFGPPGTLNGINVLDRSPVFDDIFKGRAPKVTYWVNGHQYDLAYYLTNGIYPDWATFIQSIPLTQSEKARLFATTQESVRKDIERAFGVLQPRFAIVKKPGSILG